MRILMVSTEYPPMNGASGPYTANLTRALRKAGVDVYIVCNERGEGDFSGISSTNIKNREILLRLVDKTRPDIVHIQFEGAFYGLALHEKGTTKSGTYIDKFYDKCNIPIDTTFFSAFSYLDWIKMNEIDTKSLIKKTGRIGEVLRMDGTNLEFPSESFDIAFSFSSIEHFGGKDHSGALKSLQEIERVLKPGGLAVITTEYIINEKEHIEFFNSRTIYTDLSDKLEKLQLVEPLDLRITTKTLETMRFSFGCLLGY